MIDQSVAQPAPRTTREDRARELAECHFHEIAASHDKGTWSVPSCSGLEVYTVRYSYRETVAGGESCSCPDFEHRGRYTGQACRHLLAVAIVAAELSRRGGRFITPADIDQLAEWTGIDYWSLSSAFTGERKNLCLDVTKAAIAADPDGDPEAWAESIRWWAKASGRGMYHPAMIDAPELTWEQTAHARRVSERAMREERS